ncbi:hypothetical protein HanPSC8_Chr10g0422421 [Helianthus annuus]|nr:hypothetical protein HanPSC8_Chr10g0422421 [Helianthus annuus]
MCIRLLNKNNAAALTYEPESTKCHTLVCFFFTYIIFISVVFFIVASHKT